MNVRKCLYFAQLMIVALNTSGILALKIVLFFFFNNFIKILVDCVLVLRFIDEKNCDTLILKELFFLKCLENGLGFNNCYVKVKVLVSHVRLFEIPWTVVHQAPLSIEFSWQEYWSG